MKRSRLIFGVLVLLALPAFPALAKNGGGVVLGDTQRDCQTVTTCNFKRGGSYRGCLSSYTCRKCSFVPSRCSIAGASGRVCERLVCTW
jgi:hypothetical protein